MSGLINGESRRGRGERGAQPYVPVGVAEAMHQASHAGSSLCELAALNDKEPLQFFLAVLANPVNHDPSRWGSTSVAASLGRPIDPARMRNVLLLAAARSGWRSHLPPRQARGIAAHYDLMTYVGTVARVAVAEDGCVSVPRLDIAIDCGLVADANHVARTFKRAAAEALSETLNGALKFGRTNDLASDVRVHIVRSDAPTGGIGALAIPPIMSAVVNAVFAATGQRSRRLPINPARLKLH